LPLDLLSADEMELQVLPGVGPVIARRIIEWRSKREHPWGPDDLLEVSGIGPATLERLRPFITVGEWR
jgi:competence protein ComEA